MAEFSKEYAEIVGDKYFDFSYKKLLDDLENGHYEFLVCEGLGTSQTKDISKQTSSGIKKYRDMEDAISASSSELISLYQELEDYIFSLGDDIQKKELKYYHAFSRIKNFVCVEIRSKKQEIVLYQINYKALQNPPQNSRDVSITGHYGTGDTEVTIKSIEELEEIKGMIEKSYGNG